MVSRPAQVIHECRRVVGWSGKCFSNHLLILEFLPKKFEPQKFLSVFCDQDKNIKGSISITQIENQQSSIYNDIQLQFRQ